MPNQQEILDAYKKVDSLLDQAKFSEALDHMKSWDKIRLNQFYQAYPNRYPILKHAYFDNFWAEKRVELYPKNPFVAQKPIADCDLVLGYVFYLLALNYQTTAVDKSDKYLNLALKFDSIQAAQMRLHQVITQKMGPEEKIQALLNTLADMESLAAKQGAAGFLLLADGYLHLVKTYLDQEPQKEQDETAYHAACFELWKNLTLVELELTEPRSTAVIHNAYFGEGLSLGNSFKLSTIAEIKDEAGLLITSSEIKAQAEQNVRDSFIDDVSLRRLSMWKHQTNPDPYLRPPLDPSALIPKF